MMSTAPAAHTAADALHMQRALALAERGLNTCDPNPRVGCVLVNDGAVVGEGFHARAGEAHAEVFALRAAGARARGATAYVTLEPCSHVGRTPPCADALIDAGVARVVAAGVDPNPRVAGAGLDRLRQAGVEVSTGVLAGAARRLNPGFFARFERGRPYLRLKLAMSLDARTAATAGAPTAISGPASRADVQQWRARSSAILTGAGTVVADDPRLDVRLDYGPWVRQPLRVVLDPSLRCAPGARVFARGDALVFAASGTPVPAPPSGEAPRRIEHVARGAAGLDLPAVMRRLAELEINEILAECGPRLAGALIAAGLVDELILYVAPRLFGAGAPPLADLSTVSGFGSRLEYRDVRRCGEDLRLILTPVET
jgi:diaminohydroxyphosphoribosylaminopyrimidine deaminase/5-amino-6-(5-phosphoribosylamino)uracil reductase